MVLGLKFEPQEQCLTDIIDDVKVEGSAVAAFGPSNHGAKEQLDTHNMLRYLLCRRCGLSSHPIEKCPAKIGSKNPAGRTLNESAEEFARFTRDYFRGRNRGPSNQNPRGGASAGRGCGGGRGFAPRHNGVNAVCCDDWGNELDEFQVEEEQYDDSKVVASVEDAKDLN